jgi:hypothetical protein
MINIRSLDKDEFAESVISRADVIEEKSQAEAEEILKTVTGMIK